MSQVVFDSINPATTSGTQLAAILDDFKDAVMSGLSGTARPAETTAGGGWIDTTNEGSPNFYWSYKIFNGTTDIEIFRVNLATNKASIAGSDSTFEITRISADQTGSILKLIKQRIATNGQVLDGDTIGEIQLVGRTSTSGDPVVARIKAVASDNMTSSASGTYLVFETTADGASAAAEHMRLVDGKLGIGTQAPETSVHTLGSTGIKSERQSDDANGAKVAVEKSRIAGNGSVQSADAIGEYGFNAKDSSGTKSTTAKIEAVATEGHTSGAKGTKMKLMATTATGTTLESKFEVGDVNEAIAQLKVNALNLVSQSVATSATITQLSATKAVVEFTGSTATSLRGVNSGNDTKVILLHNISTADVTLEHEHTGATAADRLKLPNSSPITISPQTSIELFYSTTDTRWKIKSGSSSSSGGSGGKNYAALLFAGTTVNGINTYNDGGGTPALPLDGTGGTATGLTTTVNTSSPLRPPSNIRLSKDGSSRQGNGWSWDFTADRADYEGGKPLVVQFRMKTSSGYVNNDVRMFVYDKDGTVLQNLLSITGDGSLSYSATTGLFTGFFSTNGSNDDYRLIWHIASTTAAAWDLDITDLIVGPDKIVPGAIGADFGTEAWADNQANATTAVRLFRHENHVIAIGTTSFTGAMSGAFAVTIPTVYTPDAAIYSSFASNNRYIIGQDSLFVDAGTGIFKAVITLSAATTISIAQDNFSDTSATAPFTWASGDKIQWTASWAVSGWAATAALSTTESMLSSAKARYFSTTQSIPAATATILNASTKSYDELNSVTTGASWKFTAPFKAKYRVSCFGQYVSRTYTVNQFTLLQLFKNGVFVTQGGVQAAQTTTAIVKGWDFTDTIELNAGDYIDFRAYNEGSVSTNTDGFFIAVEALPNLSAFSIYGITDYIESVVANANFPASNAYGDMTSITLQPGEWDVRIQAHTDRNTSSVGQLTEIQIGISTTSGNSGTGLVSNDNWTINRSNNYDQDTINIYYRMVVTTPTVVYGKVRATYAGGQPTVGGKLFARKVK